MTGRVRITTLVAAAALLFPVLASEARADCQGGSCREPGAATALAPSTELSAGAREIVLYLDAWAGQRAMSLRYGPRHPEMLARASLLATLAAEIDGVRASGARIERAEVLGWLRAAIADVTARLAELGTRCGPQHLDLRGAELRRDALREALGRWEAGETFVPTS